MGAFECDAFDAVGILQGLVAAEAPPLEVQAQGVQVAAPHLRRSELRGAGKPLL